MNLLPPLSLSISSLSLSALLHHSKQFDSHTPLLLVGCYQSLLSDDCPVHLDDCSEEMSGGIGGGASSYHNVGGGAQPNVVSIHTFPVRSLVALVHSCINQINHEHDHRSCYFSSSVVRFMRELEVEIIPGTNKRVNGVISDVPIG